MTGLQQVIYEIFKEVKSLCDKYDIDYYAIGGTCIGAVRHKGFIPWDDDLDIAVPVEQFDRFIRLARKKLPEHLEIVSFHDHPHFPRVFVRVADKRTCYIQPYMRPYPDEYHGIFIDVMPMAGKPEGIKGKLFAHKMAMYDYLVQQSMRKLKDNKSFRDKASCLLMKCLFFLTYDKLLLKWERDIKKHPVSGAALICFPWNVKVRWRSFSKDIFAEGEELPFEGTLMKCPSGWDEYLTTDFGDYMKLPPEEKRVGHHDGRVSLTVPCAVFAQKVRKKLASYTGGNTRSAH